MAKDPNDYTPATGDKDNPKAAAKAAAARRQRFIVWWQEHYSNEKAMGGQPPKELMDVWMKNEERGFSWMEEYIRKNSKAYKNTSLYKERSEAVYQFLRQIYGEDYANSAAGKKLMDDIGRGDPDNKIPNILNRLFRNRVMKDGNTAFWSRHIAFKNFWEKRGSRYEDEWSAFQGYQDEWARVRRMWSEMPGAEGEAPQWFIIRGLDEEWTDAGDPRALKAYQASDEFAGSAGYKNKVTAFEDWWDTYMGDFDIPMPQDLADAYAKGWQSLDDFFESTVRKHDAFKAAFPDYETWRAREVEQTGNADMAQYLRDRGEFLEEWSRNYDNGEPIDPELLALALEENWSITEFRNRIKQRDDYKNTGDGRKKGEEFDSYWHRLMGDVEVDAGLRDSYISGNSDDVSSMWDAIKGTQYFQTMFPQWDTFAAAQAAAGVDVYEDPMAYSEYKAAFERAFADLGMPVPPGLDNQIFASGEQAYDIEQRAEQYGKAATSTAIFTGEQADIGTALGVGDKTAGGLLRDRLKKSLEAHRTFLNSRQTQAEKSKTDTGLVTQGI